MNTRHLTRPIPLLALTSIAVASCGSDPEYEGDVDYGVDTTPLGNAERSVTTLCAVARRCATTADRSQFVAERNECVSEIVTLFTEQSLPQDCQNALRAYASCAARYGVCESYTYSYYDSEYTYWYFSAYGDCDEEYYAMDDLCPALGYTYTYAG
jgi:hypothetical protein